MTFSKTLTLAVSTSVLVGIVASANTLSTKGTEKPSVVIESRIPDYLDVNNPVMKKLQEVNDDYSQLQALYMELADDYRYLQEQMDKLLTSPVFTSQDVQVKSNAHIHQIRYVLEGTELYPLVSTFLEAENTYGINVFFLIGLVALESGWGTSERALNDNNMSGYAVYNDNSVGRKFISKEESILETARLISEDYLPYDSKYNTGKSIYEINQKYSADTNWGAKITNIANELCIKAKLWGVVEYE